MKRVAPDGTVFVEKVCESCGQLYEQATNSCLVAGRDCTYCFAARVAGQKGWCEGTSED